MKSLFLAVLLGYVAYGALMIAVHPRLIYPFLDDSRVLSGFERVELPGTSDVPVFVQERRGAGSVVLYFMGNAGSLALFEADLAAHVAADRHVIALEYRGGAGRPGRASEELLKADALRAADYALVLKKPVLVQGYSLCTGLAIHVAARRSVARVVLTAPYDRLCRLMATRSWLPACFLPFVQGWNALEDAHDSTVSVLVLHGSGDSVIPPSYSSAYESLRGVERHLIIGAGHNDITAFPGYHGQIERFLQAP